MENDEKQYNQKVSKRGSNIIVKKLGFRLSSRYFIIMLEEESRGRRPQNVNERLWGNNTPENRVEFYNPLPTKISGSLTQEQISAYQTMFRIQEITSTLRVNEINPPERRNRSPSPPPAYDSRGKRINTREQRYRRKLEEERHRLVEIALKMIPHFVAPEDYKRPVKFQDKYYIPVDQYPGINFVGLLLGPRGHTLKKLQEDSGCKIAIRGRGSVKEGKNAHDLPRGAMNFSDPLHCLIIADNEDKIQKGIKVCENIVVRAVTSPEGQNDLKRGQLRELAELNGTLREDNRPCPICGLLGHKKYECPNMETFAQKIICRKCGQSGHATIDCIMTAGAQASDESRYSRYKATSNSGNPQNWQEGSTHRNTSNYYQDDVLNQDDSPHETVTSYRSRYSRVAQETLSQNPSNEETFVPSPRTQGSAQSLESVTPTPPPGMDSQMAPMPATWGVPGMTSLSQDVISTTPSTVVSTFPPGLNALNSSGLPTDSILPCAPGLNGPPGLPENEQGSQAPPGLTGPPGL